VQRAAIADFEGQVQACEDDSAPSIKITVPFRHSASHADSRSFAHISCSRGRAMLMRPGRRTGLRPARAGGASMRKRPPGPLSQRSLAYST